MCELDLRNTSRKSKQQITTKATDSHQIHELTEQQHPVGNDLIPNGGLWAWLQVLTAFLLMFNCWGIANSFGVFQTYYQQQLLNGKSTASAISWIGSIQSFLLVVMSVLTGPLVDWGYTRYLMAVGSLLMIFGMMMVSLCHEYWQLFLAQGLLVGFGSGCLLMPAAATIPTWFSTKRAVAQGVLTTGGSLGGILFPIIFRQLQPKIGFGWATRTIAFISLATLTLAFFLIRIRITQAGKRRRMFDLSTWKDPPYTLFSVGAAIGVMGVPVPYFYAGLYGSQELHLDEDLSFYLYAIVNAGGLVGRLAIGLVAYRIGALNTLLPFMAISCIIAFAWEGIRDKGGLIAFCVLYGFFSGALTMLPATIIANLSTDLSIVGTRIGMSFSLQSFGALIGTPIAGAILGDASGTGWAGLKAWCGSCFAVGLGFVVAARVVQATAARQRASRTVQA